VGRRLTRKQIKQDEFISFVDRTFHWLGQNWRQAAVGLGGVLALALIWWALSAFMGSRNEASGKAIAGAIAEYQAPVGGAAPGGGKPWYATDTERLAAAEKAFQAVSSHYWLTPQARVAAVFLARIASDRGDQALAIRKLSELTSRRSDDPIVRLAMLDLVRLRIAKGEGTQLVGELEAMVSGKDPRLTRDTALFELARMWEHEGKPEEANRLYRKLVEDFPDSPYRPDAQQHLSSAS
jgi:tetratricopeptide (TPR) repeat protein